MECGGGRKDSAGNRRRLYSGIGIKFRAKISRKGAKGAQRRKDIIGVSGIFRGNRQNAFDPMRIKFKTILSISAKPDINSLRSILGWIYLYQPDSVLKIA
jgi:hypothetical protein